MGRCDFNEKKSCVCVWRDVEEKKKVAMLWTVCWRCLKNGAMADR